MRPSNSPTTVAVTCLRGAVIDGDFRYRLYRTWGHPRCPSVCFVMLNPSTADGDVDDPTVRKCMGFAKRMGFASIDIVNLYAFRATSPADLALARFPVGPATDEHLADALSRDPSRNGFAERVVVAWGTKAQRHRADAVLKMIRATGHAPVALGVTRWGAPRHPLYVPYETHIKPYQGDVHPTKSYSWARRRAA